MAILMVNNHWNSVLAVVVALGLGAAVGIFNGFMVTRFRIPSFVVTLAGSLALVGLQLYVLGATGTVNIQDPFVTGLTATFFPPLVGWGVAVLAIAAAMVFTLLGRARRRAAGLNVGSMRGPIFTVGAVGVAVAALVAVENMDRGLPLVVVIVVVAALFFWYITERTRFGRHIFAVGGNSEAARRAGIKIDHVRMMVFTIGSTMAALGGVLAASRLLRRQPVVRRQRPAAHGDRGPGHRRYQPLRRPRHGVVGPPGRHRHRIDSQRHGPAGPRLLGEVHRHGRRCSSWP